MGRYNPHAPSILGQEWAPIREEPYTLDTEVERGYSFVLDTATTVVSGSFFLESVPANAFNPGTAMMSVYRRGEEHLTGPLKRVVIPPVSGIVGGDGTVSSGSGVPIHQALRNPNDNEYLLMFTDPTFNQTAEVSVRYDVNAFSSELSGKRIIAVNFIYAVAGGTPDTENTIFRFATLQGTLDMEYPTPVITSVEPGRITSLGRTRLGNVNLYTDTFSPPLQPKKFPFRYQDIQRYAMSATNQLSSHWYVFGFAGTALDDAAFVTYTAMEVIYCEETRLLYGGRYGAISTSGNDVPSVPVPGQNLVQLRPSDTFAVTGKVLTPGEYTVTLTLGDTGDYENFSGGGYGTKALRQIYELPTHKGVEVVTTTREGSSFTQRSLDVIPQLSLHTSSSVVTGVHAYGELAVGNVYDGVDVAPDVVQRSGGAAVPFPQVRFYARRFGDTSTSLVLRRQSTPTIFVSITADELDALPEIVDGWREVTLRFPDDLVPTFSDTGGSSTWEWISDGLDAGSQWQVLTPRGESFATAPQDTDRATYGGTAAFTLITGQSISESADTTLIFSQDPPSVTGFAVEMEQQDLVTISNECSVEPSCIPTALYYNHLTWDARDLQDTFEDRTESGEWGDSESGQPWTTSGGTADDYFVVTGTGNMTIDVTNTLYFATAGANAYNVEVRGRVRVPVLPSGAALTPRLVARFEDTSNYYEAQISIATTGVVSLYVTKRIANVGSIISPIITLDATHTAGDVWNIAFRCQADQLLAKAWKDGMPEPLGWQAIAVTLPGDALTGTIAGVAFRADTGFSGGTIVASWLDVSAKSLDVTSFELQRRDDVDDEWQTIMRSTGTAVNEFNDYEARVGVQSQYRIRTINALEFYGSWTLDEVTAHYTWDAGLEGWTGEGSTTVEWDPEISHDGSGSLRAIESMGSGFAELRFNDGAGLRDLSALGTTLTAWVKIPEDASGTGWQGRIELQNPAFSWQAGPNLSLVKGLWMPLSYTPPASLLTSCRALGFAIGATGVNGVQSVNVDTLSQGTGLSAIVPPGVVGNGPDGNSVMIFTTNEVQDGSSNLAYVMVWTSDITEEYNFPEAGTVQLRDLYRRDFPLAFRPLERGGERFQRDIIVQNAAVPSGRVRDGFRSLRDMAWEDVSYVCVRNELGDRWFSTVLVPSGKIQRNRRLYIARIEIAEVSTDPSVVDPAEV